MAAHFSDNSQAGFGFSTEVVLVASRVKAALNGVVAEVEICHEFVNREQDDIEAVYSFSLPLDATLLGLSMSLNGQPYVAELVSRTQGSRRYDDAVTDGDSAVLLTEEAPGLYSMSVGNLQPEDRVTITLNYAEVLRWDNRKLRFYFPTTLGERYGNSHSAGLAEYQLIEHCLDNGARLDFSLTVFGELASANVMSPSHRLNQSREEGALTLSGKRLLPDRDIIVTLDAPQRYLGEVLVEQSRYGEQYAALLLAPEASCAQPLRANGAQHSDRCFQFVLDCSGSMAGDSMVQTQKALQSIAMLLESGDWFNVVRFGSSAHSLFETPRPVNSESLRQLMQWVTELEANLGGTEMELALALACKTGAHLRLDTDILLITDGEVWDSESMIAAAVDAKMRVFTVGVGSSVNQPLLARIARGTGGAAVFVSPNESMADAVVGHFKRCRSEPLVAFKVHWPHPLKQQPNHERYFGGDSIALYGASHATESSNRVSGKTSRGKTIRCKTPSSQISSDHTAGIGAVPEAVGLSYQLADNAVDCALPTRRYQGFIDGTLARIAANARLGFDAKPQKLALRYQLLSPFTCCVLVAEREQKASGLPTLRTVKHTRPAGEHGFGTVMESAPQRSFTPPLHDVVYSLAPTLPMLLSDLDPLVMPAFLRLGCEFDLTDNETLLSTLLPILNQAAADNRLALSFNSLQSIDIRFEAAQLEQIKRVAAGIDEAVLVLCLLQLLLEQVSDQRRARSLRRWVKAQLPSVPPDLLSAIRAQIHGPVAA